MPISFERFEVWHRAHPFHWMIPFSLLLVELVDYMREIAEELTVQKVYFPNEPGVFSAEGIADGTLNISSGRAYRSTRPYPLTAPGLTQSQRCKRGRLRMQTNIIKRFQRLRRI